MTKKTRLSILTILLVLFISIFVIQSRSGLVFIKFIPKKNKHEAPKLPQRKLLNNKTKYDKILIQTPTDAKGYYKRALAWRKRRNRKKAIQDLTKAIELDPNHAHAWFQRGNLLLFEESYSQALMDLNRAIELNPNNSNWYNDRGNANKHIGNKEQALLDYNRAIELNPKTPFAYYNRALLIERSNYEQAIADYTKAIEFAPKRHQPYFCRGDVLLDMGHFQNALDDFTSAIKINPRYASAYGLRGIIFKKKGLYKKAVSDFSKAIKLKPQKGVYYRRRAESLYQLNYFEKAIADYKKYKTIDPGSKTFSLNELKRSEERIKIIKLFDHEKPLDKTLPHRLSISKIKDKITLADSRRKKQINLLKQIVEKYSHKNPDMYIPLGDEKYFVFSRDVQTDWHELYFVNMPSGYIDKIFDGHLLLEDTWINKDGVTFFVFRTNGINDQIAWKKYWVIKVANDSFGMDQIQKSFLAHTQYDTYGRRCTNRALSLGLVKSGDFQDYFRYTSKEDSRIKIRLDIDEDDCLTGKRLLRSESFMPENGYYVRESTSYILSRGKREYEYKNLAEKLRTAHTQSLKVYQNTQNRSISKNILDEYAIGYLFFNTHIDMTEAEYLTILNDYAYYCIGIDTDLSILLLNRVLSIDPKRSVAHLNMAEALYEVLQNKPTHQEIKTKLTKQIIYHYNLYKKLNKKRIEDFEKFLNLNIMNAGSKDICAYVKNLYNDNIYGNPRINEIYLNGFNIDVNNDGKKDTITTENNKNGDHINFKILKGSKIMKLKRDSKIDEYTLKNRGFRFAFFKGKTYKVFDSSFVTKIEDKKEKIICGCEQ